MSPSSWRLFRHGNGRWYARARIDGRKVERSTGTSDRTAAEGIVAAWSNPTPATPPPSKSDAFPSSPAGPVVAHDASPAKPGQDEAERAAGIAAKLRGLGRGAASDSDGAVEPDDVVAPGESVGSDDDDGGEEGELLADLLAEGVIVGVQKGAHKIARAYKPPHRAAEPNETCTNMARSGLQARLRAALGRRSKLGPNAKILLGLSGMMAAMLWNAEPIEAPPAAAAAPSSARAPAPPPAPAPRPPPEDLDEHPTRELVTTGQGGAAAGRFR